VEWQDYENRGLDLVRKLMVVTRGQKELCEKLLSTRPWQFFMVVFTGTDRIQHCLNEHVERLHDDAACRADVLTAAVRDYFVSLDGWLGELIEACGEDTHFVVVSDHGFGPVERSVFFNKWLVDEGLLALNSRNTADLKRWKSVMNAVGIKRSTFTALGRALGLSKVVEGRVQMLNPFVGGIDWSRTKVYYSPANGFYLNVKGRETYGIVDPGSEYDQVRADLIRRLEGLKDPIHGGRLIPVVKRREELFKGPRVVQLPDVFIEFLDQPYDAFMQEYDAPSVFVKNDWCNGTHRRGGLYIGAGPDLVRGPEVEGLEIFDVAPNVLHLMGHAIPKHMDGRFRPDLFVPERREGARFEAFSGNGESRSGITEEEEKDLEAKLRGLGYL
jgi:predicted AlkP superfamily phosphohydrolase/phosphomutase